MISCCSEIRFGKNQTQVDGGSCLSYGTPLLIFVAAVVSPESSL